MNQLTHRNPVILLPILISYFFLFSIPAPALAGQPLLKKYIIEFNVNAVEKSLTDYSYRGAEGILAVNPEEARSLGMKSVIDEDYLESMMLFDQADEYLEKAHKAMTSVIKESSPGYYSSVIYENFLVYKECSMEAKKRLMSYRSRLNPENDERLNEAVCNTVMDRILDESLGNGEMALRDKLAQFYNICHGINFENNPLTVDNVRFVNHVFYGFIQEAPQEDKDIYDLDLDHGYGKRESYNWKDAAESGTSEYVALIDKSLKKLGDSIYPVDPLLFLALMKKESSFIPSAVSSVGAAGLTQIMPETAKELGLENIYTPEYYYEAVSLLKRERTKSSQAFSALHGINEENGLELAEQARKLMQESLELGKKRKSLFDKYEKELIKNRNDDRLEASIAIEHGLKYFAGLMKRNSGDMSLALASYNAGQSRVRDYKGIPPFRETIGFRNKVLGYYREYLDKVMDR